MNFFSWQHIPKNNIFIYIKIEVNSIKFVYLDEIYNFIVQTVSIEFVLVLKHNI
jgi:hypothetical protein